MVEQGAKFRRILAAISKAKGDVENDDPHDQAGYESENDNGLRSKKRRNG